MGNVLLALFFFISLASAVKFKNAYIQNVKSGRCVTINKDALLDPLSASKCVCGPYQFWKNEDGEHVINEVAWHGYMDELFGKPKNGETVGIYDLTGLPWQKWRFNEHDDGSYSFIVKHTSKCLHQGSGGKIDQWDCDDNDDSQKWKVIENPCGKLPKLPSGRFQLQNPQTGKCAVVLNNSDGWWAKIVTHKCSCENDYQYWKINKKTMVSQGKSKQCFANWSKAGHPGVTQCICVDDAIHRWTFLPFEDGSFNLVSQVGGQCALADGGSENSPLGLGECDRDDAEQKWRFYDACNPEPPAPPPPPPPPPKPTNVIPSHLNYFFENGQMNWLTPTRYTLLIGGRWDSVKSVWITVDGREIRPNTDMWTIYFGNTNPSFLNVLFSGNKSFNDTFGWMSSDFFRTWTSWNSTPVPPPQPQNVIPSYLTTYFTNGQLNWLTPTRYTLLIGGKWDPIKSVWITVDGRQIQPNTDMWTIYFGDASPSFLNILFQGGKTWNDTFGWMTSNFFQTWTPSQLSQEQNVIPSSLTTYFNDGHMNWLTPQRYNLLVGGRWDSVNQIYYTASGSQIRQSSSEWNTYFGDLQPSDLTIIFDSSDGSWNDVFGWMTPTFFTIWNGWQEPAEVVYVYDPPVHVWQ